MDGYFKRKYQSITTKMIEKCLNCNQVVENKFCSFCGQKNSTHRFTWNHLITHDFVHGVFHLDKGILFTLKELFTRPGHSIREYIQGQRTQHYNYFTLFLITVAISNFISHYSLTDTLDLYENKNEMTGFDKVYNKYDKLILFLNIPFWALIVWIGFKKSMHNYIECIVLLIYLLCGILSVNLISNLASIFYNDINLLRIIERVKIGLITFYIFVFLYQYFSVFYINRKKLIIRAAFTTFLLLLIITFNDIIVVNIGRVYF